MQITMWIYRTIKPLSYRTSHNFYIYKRKSRYKHHILTLIFMQHCVASGYHAARENERSVKRDQ